MNKGIFKISESELKKKLIEEKNNRKLCKKYGADMLKRTPQEL